MADEKENENPRKARIGSIVNKVRGLNPHERHELLNTLQCVVVLSELSDKEVDLIVDSVRMEKAE